MASDFNIDFEKELKELAPLIKKIASNFITSNITADELFQEGMLGVYEAKQKYNPKKDTKFSTYAYFWIKKYIMKYVGVEKSKYEFNDKLLQNKIDEKQKEDLPKKTKITFPKKMPKLEEQILDLLFNEENTLNEISEILNITREKVRQIKEKGLRRLRIAKDNGKDNGE